MYYGRLHRFVEAFCKLAALEWPEATSWVPGAFKEEKAFQEFPRSTLDKIFSDYGLHDFRVRTKMTAHEDQVFYNFYSFMDDGFRDATRALRDLGVYVIQNQESYPEDEFKRLFNTIKRMNQAAEAAIDAANEIFRKNPNVPKLLSPIVTKDKKIKYNKGMSLIKVYNNFRKRMADLTPNDVMKPIEKSDAFKSFSKRGTATLVFSTKLEDLVGMSSRGIQSCQSLHCSEGQPISEVTGHRRSLVGTILSRYTGIVYVTSGSPHKGRGEKMLYRSLVRVVYNMETDEPAIIIDKMYPDFNRGLMKVIKKELSDRADVPVIAYTDVDVGEYYIEPEEEIPEEYETYTDVQYGQSVREYLLFKKQSKFRRRMAARELPPEHIVDMVNDEDSYVRLIVAERVDPEHLINLIKDSSDQIRRVVAERLPERLLAHMIDDQHIEVRRAVATRIPVNMLIYMLPDPQDEHFVVNKVLSRLPIEFYPYIMQMYDKLGYLSRQTFIRLVMGKSIPRTDNERIPMVRRALEAESVLPHSNRELIHEILMWLPTPIVQEYVNHSDTFVADQAKERIANEPLVEELAGLF